MYQGSKKLKTSWGVGSWWSATLEARTPSARMAHLQQSNNNEARAIWTPTRRYHRPRAPQPELTVCPFCGYEAASARHFWADCPRFNNARIELQSMHHIAASWWQCQPRCTSKSGWITRQAARTAALRAHCAVAACKLGIRIYHAVSPA